MKLLKYVNNLVNCNNTVMIIILLISIVNSCSSAAINGNKDNQNQNESATNLEILGDNESGTELKFEDLLQLGDAVEEGRTYAHHFAKRMAVLLLPLMFKLGVVMTMLTFLTFISIKSLVVGVGLMVIGLSHVLARAYTASSGGQNLAAAIPPLIVSPFATSGLFRQPPAFVPTGWERRNGVNTPRSNHDAQRDAYKNYVPTTSTYGIAPAVDLTSAATSNQNYYVVNSADPGVLQAYS